MLTLAFEMALFGTACATTTTLPTSTECSITTAYKQANEHLSFDEFDREGVVPVSWRQLSNRRCDAAAVESAEDYLVHARFRYPSEQRDVMFHIAQSLGEIGKSDEAALMVASAKDPAQQPDAELDWNTYLNGTWAFFKKNKHELQAAQRALAKEPGEGNQLNASALRGLLNCFDLPYHVAYDNGCRLSH